MYFLRPFLVDFWFFVNLKFNIPIPVLSCQVRKDAIRQPFPARLHLLVLEIHRNPPVRIPKQETKYAKCRLPLRVLLQRNAKNDTQNHNEVARRRQAEEQSIWNTKRAVFRPTEAYSDGGERIIRPHWALLSCSASSGVRRYKIAENRLSEYRLDKAHSSR